MKDSMIADDRHIIQDLLDISKLSGRKNSLSTIYINSDTPPKKILDELKSSKVRIRTVKTPYTREVQEQNLTILEKEVKKLSKTGSFQSSVVIFSGIVYSKEDSRDYRFLKLIHHNYNVGETKVRNGDKFDVEPFREIIQKYEAKSLSCDEAFCTNKMVEILSQRKEGKALLDIGYDSIAYSLSMGVQYDFIIISDALENIIECQNENCLYLNTRHEHETSQLSCIRCGQALPRSPSMFDKCKALADKRNIEHHIIRPSSSFYKMFNTEFFGILGKRRF